MANAQVADLAREDILRIATTFTWDRKMPKWTVVVGGQEFPARPLILAAAGAPPNDSTNSHMAVARLENLGFEVRYEGQPLKPSSGPALKTTYEGKEFLHRQLWSIAKLEAMRSNELKRDWFEPNVVAMIFAFHTIEAYLNFAGALLDPATWSDERNAFHKEPYRGFEGKLRKVMELASVPWNPATRPLQTIIELKRLRDLIVHGRPEEFSGEVVHVQATEPGFPLSRLRSMVTPRERLGPVLHDVNELVQRIHDSENFASIRETDPWFGKEALEGPTAYNTRHTTLAAED